MNHYMGQVTFLVYVLSEQVWLSQYPFFLSWATLFKYAYRTTQSGVARPFTELLCWEWVLGHGHNKLVLPHIYCGSQCHQQITWNSPPQPQIDRHNSQVPFQTSMARLSMSMHKQKFLYVSATLSQLGLASEVCMSKERETHKADRTLLEYFQTRLYVPLNV